MNRYIVRYESNPDGVGTNIASGLSIVAGDHLEIDSDWYVVVSRRISFIPPDSPWDATVDDGCHVLMVRWLPNGPE